MSIETHKDLDVWKKALDWAERVYLCSAKFPHEERFGLTIQLRRAAISVACNIAEGAGRGGTKEFVRFIGIAKGSLAEAHTLLLLARRMAFLEVSSADILLEQADELGRMLPGLQNALGRTLTNR